MYINIYKSNHQLRLLIIVYYRKGCSDIQVEDVPAPGWSTRTWVSLNTLLVSTSPRMGGGGTGMEGSDWTL